MAERNERGQFMPGNKAGPGRPSRATEGVYLRKMTELVTLEKWTQIVNKAITDAIGGNGPARQWLSDYVIGKPPQILELRGTDAAVLRQVIQRLEARGVSAGDVFESMLQELQAADRTEVESAVRNDTR